MQIQNKKKTTPYGLVFVKVKDSTKKDKYKPAERSIFVMVLMLTKYKPLKSLLFGMGIFHNK